MTAAADATVFVSAAGLEPTSVRIVDHVANLSQIFEPTVNVVVLRRVLAPAIIEEARHLTRELPLGLLATIDAGPAGLRAIRESIVGVPQLAEDVHFSVEVLGELTGSERIGVRLARVERAMCPGLHVDKVTLRVVCTYEGRGTEYVSNEHVDRRQLGHGTGAVAPACRVQAAQPGDIVLLKGESWPDNAGRGAVHRSPEASPSSPRLLMTLDPL